MEDNQLIKKIISGIRDASITDNSTVGLSDYYSTSYSHGTKVNSWKTVNFGNDNKFDVSLTLHDVLDDSEENIVSVSSFSENEIFRKYTTNKTSVEGTCLTLKFDYENREGCGIEIAVPIEQKQEFKDYLFGALIEQFSQAADTAISCAFSWSGNDMACNIGVRTTVYFHKNDKVLFPVSGSGLFKANQEPYFKGEITDPGKANNIYNDLDSNDLDEFEKITNASGCNYPDFEELQEQANDGAAIIGVKENNTGSGHIVIIMPESFNERSDIERSFNITSNEIIILPITLECGQGTKEVRPFENAEDIVEFKWYKYEN